MSITAHHLRFASRALVVFAVISVSVFAVLTVRSRNKGAGLSTPSVSATASASEAIVTSAALQGQASAARLEMERITITPRGFEPGRITRPVGGFLLAVDNRSGLQSARLQLYPFNGEISGEPWLDSLRLTPPPLFDVAVPREQPGWRALENLPPGNYALTEANHAGFNQVKLGYGDAPQVLQDTPGQRDRLFRQEPADEQGRRPSSKPSGQDAGPNRGSRLAKTSMAWQSRHEML